MRRSCTALSWGVWGLVASGAWGCAASALHFSGSPASPATTPRGVVVTDAPPSGHTEIGSVSADCEPLAPGSALQDVRASDLSCSRALLIAALKERAASAGGSVLVGAACGEGFWSDRITCRAEVWRPEAQASLVSPPLALNEDPLASAPGAPPYGSVHEAWNIRVGFSAPAAAPASSGVEPRAPHQIEEFDFPRAGFRPLGDVVARCSSGCSPASLRAALVAAAAHAGGTSIVGARCVNLENGPQCVASVAAPEHDERLAGAH